MTRTAWSCGSTAPAAASISSSVRRAKTPPEERGGDPIGHGAWKLQPPLSPPPPSAGGFRRCARPSGPAGDPSAAARAATGAGASPCGPGAPRRGPPTPPPADESTDRIYRWTHPRILIEIITELRRVVWPGPQETRSLTTVVIIVAVAVGAVLGSVDWIFNRLLENVLLP